MAGDYSREEGKGEIFADRRPPTEDRRFLAAVSGQPSAVSQTRVAQAKGTS